MKTIKLLSKLFDFRENLMIQLVEWTKPIYGRLFQKSTIPWKINLEKLKQFPPKTLGNDLALFLKNEGLDLMPKFESHDVYHVLFKYKTTVVDESRMQFLLMGNKKYSLYIIGTNLIAMIFYPEKIHIFFREYLKGKEALSIRKWDFRFLLNEKTTTLRQMIFKEDITDNILFI